MEGTEQVPRRSRRTIASIALVAAGLVGGAVAGGTLAAGAQSSSSSGSTSTADTVQDESVAHHAGETLLTGTTAEKVRAAALKAVPGGTILRVETDAEGSPYEAHMRKADGTMVTVKVNKSFAVTAVEAGHGAR